MLDDATVKKLLKEMKDIKESLRKGQVIANPDPIMNSEEAAEYLRISRKQLDLIKMRKEIPFHKREKCVWYRKSDIDRWLLSFRVQALN